MDHHINILQHHKQLQRVRLPKKTRRGARQDRLIHVVHHLHSLNNRKRVQAPAAQEQAVAVAADEAVVPGVLVVVADTGVIHAASPWAALAA